MARCPFRPATCCWSASRSCGSTRPEASRSGGALELLAELAADAGTEALEAHGHRALPDPHALRDLARREGSLQVEEADGLLLGAFAQPVDHFADGAQLGLLLHLLVGSGRAPIGQTEFAASLFGRLVV